MHIGVPKEIKPLEGRVGLIPAAVSDLVKQGHKVNVETCAGDLSGYSDEMYRQAGAAISGSAEELYANSRFIIKVKEPYGQDLDYLTAEHVLFSYLHLAAAPELTRRLQDIGLTAVGFETVQEQDMSLPLLAPMSDIAGRLSVQIGAHLLHQPQGGKGLLLGGLPAAERGKVVILGAGVAGGNAAAVAAGLGAQVTVFDRKRDKLACMRALGDNVTGLYPYEDEIQREVLTADLLVGAVLVTGEKAPHLVSADLVSRMQAGSVIVDISVDQGGCIETTRPTNYESPTFTWNGIVHFGVTNMPGAVPKTASQALSASLIPYVHRLLSKDWQRDTALKAGINVMAGEICHPGVKNSLA